MAAGGDETFKLPMRRWLSDLVDSKQIDGLEWFDKERRSIKVPWTKKLHPGWENCNKVVIAWAEHQHRDEKKGAKSDFSTLKANFRNAIHKSEDFKEITDQSQLDNQCGNFRVYRILTRAEVEAKKLEKKQKDTEKRKRKNHAKSSPGGKLVCNEQNYDDGLLKKVPDKDLGVPSPLFEGLYSPNTPYLPGTMQSPILSVSPLHLDSQSPCNMNFQNQISTNTGLDCDQNPMYGEGVTALPMVCSSDQSYHDPVAQSMQQHNIQCTQDLASLPSTANTDITYQVLQSLHEVPTNDLHKCELTVSYNNGQVFSEELRAADKGYRLFYGDENHLKEVLQKCKTMGKTELSDYTFPTIRLPHPKSEFKHLQDILNISELGLTFRYDVNYHSFYVKRLCQSQIFYLDPHQPGEAQTPIKIERNQEVCIFSYSTFVERVKYAMMKNDPQLLVYPIIHLSIGSKSNLDHKPSLRGIKVKIIINSLKRFLDEPLINGEMSIRLSGQNEMDKLLDQWKSFKMSSPS